MKKGYAIFPVLGMLGLILDSRTAAQAAAEGVELVLRTALPALFPFFVLSALTVPYCSGIQVPWLADVLCVPPGWEAVFLLGCVGGYPVGAQCVAQGYACGQLDRGNAQRMLGICTNCGPSFLFGIVAAAFSGLWAPAMVYLICILSAVCTAALWPAPASRSGSKPNIAPVSLPQAVQMGLRSMASVSAWILLGKILLAFCGKYLFPFLPDTLGILLGGLLELTNGCLSLKELSEPIRFPAACSFAAFGGLCVWMQVNSLCSAVQLRTGTYLAQKAIQSILAVMLSYLFTHFGSGPTLLLMAIFLILRKKAVEISKPLVYNGGN